MQECWSLIEVLPDFIKYSRKIFVVIAKDVEIMPGKTYTTDPYCVWYEESREDDVFVRWPHPFPPTHFYVLPTNFD